MRSIVVLIHCISGHAKLRTFSCLPAYGTRRRYRPYFENYTVDASIFELIFDQLILMILKIISQFRVGSKGPNRFLIKLM
jgi:hypothetical protein